MLQLEIDKALAYQEKLTAQLEKQLTSNTKFVKQPLSMLKNPKFIFSNWNLIGTTLRRKCINRAYLSDTTVDNFKHHASIMPNNYVYILDTTQKKYDLSSFNPEYLEFILFKNTKGFEDENHKRIDELALTNYYLEKAGFSYRIAKLSNPIDTKLIRNVYLKLLKTINQEHNLFTSIKLDRAIFNQISANEFYLMYNPNFAQDTLHYYYTFLRDNRNLNTIYTKQNIIIPNKIKAEFDLDVTNQSFQNKTINDLLKLSYQYNNQMQIQVKALFNKHNDPEIADLLSKILNRQNSLNKNNSNVYYTIPKNLAFYNLGPSIRTEDNYLKASEIVLPAVEKTIFTSTKMKLQNIDKPKIDYAPIMPKQQNLTGLFNLIDPLYGQPKLFWLDNQVKLLLGNTQLRHLYSFTNKEAL